MKKAKKYTKKNKKYTKKNKKYTKKNKKITKKNKQNLYFLKGGYKDGFIPQVDFRPPGDPNFDDPFYQYQEGNDTCPFYPVKSEVKKCYEKHNGTKDSHEEADNCVQQLIDDKYTEIPGKCNRYTCCDKFCGPITCPPWSRLITRGIAVPYHNTINYIHWLNKKVPEVVEDITFAEEKIALKGAEKLVEENKEDIKKLDEVIEEIEPPIKIETASPPAPDAAAAPKEKSEEKPSKTNAEHVAAHKNPAHAAGGSKRRKINKK